MEGAGGYFDIDQFGVFYIGLVEAASGTADFTVGIEGSADFDLLEIDFLPSRAPFWRNHAADDFQARMFSTRSGA